MSDYLILHHNSQEYETVGFENDDRCWISSGTMIEVDTEENIVLHKEALSSSPLFYANTPEIFVASSCWQVVCSLLKEYRITLRINLNYVYNYLKFQCPFTDETFCRDIFYLRNGERVCFQPDGKRSAHLQPSVSEANESPPDLNSYLRKQLTNIDFTNTFFHLSSGLDSSILAILASKTHSKTPVKVATFRTRGRGASNELETVYRLARDFKFQLHVFDFITTDIFSAGRELIEDVLGYPIGHPSHLTRFLLDRQISHQAKTIVAGRGPDECLAGYAWHTSEYADTEKHLQRLTVTDDDLLKRLFRQELNTFLERRVQYSHIFWQPGITLTLRQRLQYDLLSLFEAWNIIEEALAFALGVYISNPFLEPGLMKALLSLPDRFRIRNNEQKWFLRETFKNQYPIYLLNNPKRALTLDVQSYLADLSFDNLMKIIYYDSIFAQKYLTREGCEYLIRNTLEDTRNFGWQIWSIYLCSVAYDLLD